MRIRPFTFASAAVALAAPAAAAGIAIAHTPAACVLPDRYARFVATASPAAGVASAELQFRGEGGSDWYAVSMTPADGGWAAYLPRPTRRLTAVEYRIAMTGTDAAASSTPAHRVAVDAACGSGDAVVEVAAPIVVRVPPGAPPVPPVPAGFSPAGVVAAEERRGISTTAKVITGASVAGLAAAAAAAAGTDREPLPSGPIVFSLDESTPRHGSVISVSRDTLIVTMIVQGGPRQPQPFIWDYDLMSPDGVVCAEMRGTGEASIVRPLVVYLTSPIMQTGACPSISDVDRARILIVLDGAVVYDQVHPLQYRLQP